MGSQKIALGPGEIEWDGADGVGRARAYFLGRMKALYPQTFTDAVTATVFDATFLREWRRKYPRLVDEWIPRQMQFVGQLERSTPGGADRYFNDEIPRITFAPRDNNELPPEAGGPMRSAKPYEETKADYLAIAKAHFDARANRLVAELASRQMTAHRRRRRTAAHFDWLVHYLLGKQVSFGQIALRHGSKAMKTRKDHGRITVWKAIRDLAAFIGVTLPKE